MSAPPAQRYCEVTIMQTSSPKRSKNDQNDDLSTPVAFYVFAAALAAGVLGFLWVLFQMTFL